MKHASTDIETFWGWCGGNEVYGENLAYFLSLLYVFAKEKGYDVEDVWTREFEAPKRVEELNEEEENLLLVLAAFSVLDLSIPIENIYRIFHAEANIKNIKKLQGWILEGLVGTNVPTLKLRSPVHAKILLGHFGVYTEARICGLYKLLFDFSSPVAQWKPQELELLRHIFRRLNDSRFRICKLVNRPIEINMLTISEALYEPIRGNLEAFLCSCDDISTICKWSSTIQRINDVDLQKALINRVTDLAKNNKINDPGAFVSFCSVLVDYHIIVPVDAQYKKVIQNGLDILDYPATLKIEIGRQNNRRVNQIIHTYCGLLKALLKGPSPCYEPERIKPVIIKLLKNHSKLLDSWNLDTLGETLPHGSAVHYYMLARDKSLENIRKFPRYYIKQALTYMEETKYKNDKKGHLLEDIKRLIDIVSNRRNGSIDSKDINRIKKAATVACEMPSLDSTLKSKFTAFIKGI